MIKVYFLIVLIALSSIGHSQSVLTVEKIMQDPAGWVGTSPSDIRWNDESSEVFFSWNPQQKALDETFSYSMKSEKIKGLSIDEEKALIESGVYNAGHNMKLFIHEGVLLVKHLKSGKQEELLSLENGFSSLHFIDDNTLGFSNGKSIYTFDIDKKLLRHFAGFSQAKSGKPSLNEQDQFLSDQQEELMMVLMERKEKRELRKEKREKLASEFPIEIDEPKGAVRGIRMNKSLSHLAFRTYESAKGNKETLVPHFVTEDGYTETKSARAKVGAQQAKSKLYIFSIDSSKTIEPKLEQLPGIKDQPAYFADYADRLIDEESEREDRKVNVSSFKWSPNGELLLANILSDDNKDRWIVLVDKNTGDLTTLSHQHDDAWIGGPGIGGWSFWGGVMDWMPNGNSVWYQSEASGYSHLYMTDVTTLQTTQLTYGEYEVYDPFLSKDHKHFYFTANKVNPGIRHFYKMPVDGGEPVQLTSMVGNNEVTLSPDEKQLAIRYSAANKPWELYIQSNKAGAEAVKVTQSTTSEFDEYSWRMPDFVSFEAEDRAQVPARLYKPEKANGAAVIFVHGAGYLQNAHQWWSSYFREYQFHNLLCDLGYTVLDIDYRASAGYGREWRTGIYRHMGGKDLSDQVDGAKYLVEEHGVAADRIGIYGGSYGGFITLMALFNHSDVFKSGAALRSVTDWAHYNHGYTENILNSPVLDSIAYRRSSPIYFADGLEGHLLMCHGMVDDNVQFQDIVRLSQRLIELGKDNWELAVYPVEPHGFKEPSSWTDEYKRILKLFENTLK